MNLNLSETERERIANALCAEIQAYESASEDLRKRWDDHEDMYQANAPAESVEIIEGMGGYAMPMWKPKLDRVVGTVYSSLFSQRPVVQCLDVSGQGKNIEKLERTLDNLADKAGVELPVKRALRTSGNTNLGTVCIRPTVDENGIVNGLKAESYNPRRIMVYPVECDSISECKTFGYQSPDIFYRIKRKQKEGIYYEGKVHCGSDASENDPGSDDTVKTDAASTPDEWVNRWVLFPELDLDQFKDRNPEDANETDGTGYKRYVCTLDYTGKVLLSMEPYGSRVQVSGEDTGEFKEYEHAEMVEFRLIPEEEDGLLSRYCLAYPMKVLQDCFSDCFTTILQGSQMAAFPPVACVGGSLGKKYQRLKPAEVLDLPAGTEFQVVPVRFDPAVLPQVMEILQSFGDALTYGRLGSGQELGTKRTATEIDVLSDAIADAKDNHTQSIAPSIARLWEVLLMYLRHHYWDLKKAYGDAIEISEEELNALTAVRLEVSGKTGASNPSVTLRKIMALLQIVKENPEFGVDPSKLFEKLMETMEFSFDSKSVMFTDGEKMLLAQGAMPAEIIALRAMRGSNDNGLAGGVQAGGVLGSQPAVLGDAQGGELGSDQEPQIPY